MSVDSKILCVDSFQLNDQLSTTGYTNGWILEILSKYNEKFQQIAANSKVKNIEAKDICGAKGFMSRVFRVVVEFENKDEYSFVMKIPTVEHLNLLVEKMGMGEEAKTQMLNVLDEAHNKEIEAYQLLKNVPAFPTPEIYYTEKRSNGNPGLILMEDLSGKATTVGLSQSVSEKQCFEVARHFAHFQAHMSKNSDLWKGKYLTSFHTNYNNQADFTRFMNKLIEMKRDGLEDTVKKMLNLDIVKFNEYALIILPQKLNAIILCHGDAHSNNFMMKLAENGSVPDEIEAIIDWQIIFEGNPYHDLARFMVMGADGEIRRKCEKQVIDFHYDIFCDVSKELGLEVKFTKEEAHKLYDYAMIQQTYETVGMANFTANTENDDLNEQNEKAILRAKFAVADALKRMDKHGIFKGFPIKN